MSHFAKIENGIVTQVIVAEKDYVDTLDGRWVQTSYRTFENKHPENRPLRGNFAGVGSIYDEANDVFYEPQPFPSWSLNKSTWSWEPPVPSPDPKGGYAFHRWDEAAQEWKEITNV